MELQVRVPGNVVREHGMGLEYRRVYIAWIGVWLGLGLGL